MTNGSLSIDLLIEQSVPDPFATKNRELNTNEEIDLDGHTFVNMLF